MVKVLVVDDHAVVREGIKQIIASTSDLTFAGEATCGSEALKKIQENIYDIVLLDIGLPDISGLGLLKDLKSKRPELPILILSVRPEQHYAIRSLKAGASGYLNKSSAPEELIIAIRKVSQGGCYLSGDINKTMFYSAKMNKKSAPHEFLSEREYEVMMALASGDKIRDVAKALFLSPKTVSTFRQRILTKMNMKSNCELAKYVIENHLSE